MGSASFGANADGLPQTWTCPADCDGGIVRVQCWGAGGGGGYPIETINPNVSRGAQGGGGGAYSESALILTIGVEYTFSVGKGGSGAPITTIGSLGVSGGDTTFDGGAAGSVVAKGGSGGGDGHPVEDGFTIAGDPGLASGGTGTIKFDGGYGTIDSTTDQFPGGAGGAGGGGAGTNQAGLRTSVGNAAALGNGLGWRPGNFGDDQVLRAQPPLLLQGPNDAVIPPFLFPDQGGKAGNGARGGSNTGFEIQFPATNGEPACGGGGGLFRTTATLLNPNRRAPGGSGGDGKILLSWTSCPDFIARGTNRDLFNRNRAIQNRDRSRTSIIRQFLGKNGPREYRLSGTWTCPSGVGIVYIECWGGGGAGGRGSYLEGGSVIRESGSGGGGGDYAAGSVLVTPGVTYSVTVGTGGANTGDPENGGNSNFEGADGAFVRAIGGRFGVSTGDEGFLAVGGLGGGNAFVSTGTVTRKGGNGGSSGPTSETQHSYGGGGGGSGGVDGDGSNGAPGTTSLTDNSKNGAGGGPGAGGGASGGNGGGNFGSLEDTSLPGGGAGNYPGGGGGGASAFGNSIENGGKGGDGCVIIHCDC